MEARGGGATGLGFTYGETAVATLIERKLAPVMQGRDAFDIGTAWEAMSASIRNAGRPGIGMMAISAIDVAL